MRVLSLVIWHTWHWLLEVLVDVGLVQMDDYMADGCHKLGLGEAVFVRMEGHIVNELGQNLV